MKKPLIFLLCSVLFLFCFTPVSLAAPNPIKPFETKIVVNGTALNLEENQPMTQSDRTLLPLRAAFEAMDTTVDWDTATKTVTAYRGGSSIRLTIGSATVTVDGMPKKLDVPAVIVNDRTYVPLRFIGEAFGGTVNWLEESKTVDIYIAPLDTTIPYQLFFNNQQLIFTQDTFMQKGQKFLPFEEMLDFIDQNIDQSISFSWSKNNGVYNISYDGVKYQVTVDSNQDVINNKAVEIVNHPLTVNGGLYMPLHFMDEVFGALIYQDPATEAIHIYFNRLKFKHDFLPVQEGYIVQPQIVNTAQFADERTLVLSDNPEIIKDEFLSDGSATLWQYHVNSSGSRDFRVFAWHMNETGSDIRLAVTIENNGNKDIVISNANGISRTTQNGWAHYDVGLPLAEGVLDDIMLQSVADNTVIPAHSTVVLQEYDLSQGWLRGVINDFTLAYRDNSQSAVDCRIRVVCSNDPDCDLAQVKSSVVPLIYKHPRGVWSASTLATCLPDYTVGTDEVAYSISNGVTDNIYNKATSLVSGDQQVDNLGHFGVNYKVTIPIINNADTEQIVKVRLNARGGQYAGAVKINGELYLIPVIDPMEQTVELLQYAAPPGASRIELELMHAGGANLAVAIDILS